MINLVDKLNAPKMDDRLEALKEIKRLTDIGELSLPKATNYVNNHIHTTYSFSPYSPTKALYMAWQNGLNTAGIMDHDSLGGAKEFIQAAKIIDMPITVGIECRVSLANTRLNGLRVNNPDQISVAYVAIHGVPHQNIDKVNNFFAPYREYRNVRNKKMCENITALIKPYGLELNFERDVLPLSSYSDTGSVTERHILFALTKKIVDKYKTPIEVVNFIKNSMNVKLSSKIEAQILDGVKTPEFYEYDILGALKSDMVEKFYIPATDECPDIIEYIKIAKECGGVSAYAYLGDIGDSVTGDKKSQKFEDDYLELLIDEIKTYGFNAITYMPTRNTISQLEHLMEYCDENGLFQISGEDINSPRQQFICKALDNPMFSHLIDATYALIGHEVAATNCIDDAMFSEKTKEKFPNIYDRIAYYMNMNGK